MVSKSIPENFIVFKDRLKEMQGSSTTTDFAKKLGLSRSAVSFYLSGERIPDAVTLRKICLACSVSADYLLGLDAKPIENSDLSVEKQCAEYLGLTRENIRHLHAWNNLQNVVRKQQKDASQLNCEEEKAVNSVGEFDTVGLKMHRKRAYFWLINSIIGTISDKAYDLLNYYNDILMAKELKRTRQAKSDVKYGDLIGRDNANTLLENGFQVFNAEQALSLNWMLISDILKSELLHRAPVFKDTERGGEDE